MSNHEKNNGRYKCVLAAVDYNNLSNPTVPKRAKELADDIGAELALVCTLERINAYGPAYAYPKVADLETKLANEVKGRLATVASQVGVPAYRQHVEFGTAKSAIVRKARELEANLIVVGRQNRHNIPLLTGSSANAILDSAPCDVLAVQC